MKTLEEIKAMRDALAVNGGDDKGPKRFTYEEYDAFKDGFDKALELMEERERAQKKALDIAMKLILEQGLPAATWFCEGPYYEPPSKDAPDLIRLGLREIEKLTKGENK